VRFFSPGERYPPQHLPEEGRGGLGAGPRARHDQ
jgi:hypothetical protein